MQDIFVYGTLQSPEIVKKLTGKSFGSLPAVLQGYKLISVKDCDYPAIIEQMESVTVGLLLQNVDDLSLAIISFYEGDEYEKRQITALVNGETKNAFTFVWKKGIEFLSIQNWKLDEFEKNSLENYLNKIIPETLETFYKK